MNLTKSFLMVVIVFFVGSIFSLITPLHLKAWDKTEMKKITNKLCTPGKVHMKSSFKPRDTNSLRWDSTSVDNVILFADYTGQIPQSGQPPRHTWSTEASNFAVACMALIPPNQRDDTTKALISACDLIADDSGRNVKITPSEVKKALKEFSNTCHMPQGVRSIYDPMDENSIRSVSDLVTELQRQRKNITDCKNGC